MLLPVHQNNCRNVTAYSKSIGTGKSLMFFNRGVALETAISTICTELVFPSGRNVGQIHVAHSDMGIPSCFTPIIHSAKVNTVPEHRTATARQCQSSMPGKSSSVAMREAHTWLLLWAKSDTCWNPGWPHLRELRRARPGEPQNYTGWQHWWL